MTVEQAVYLAVAGALVVYLRPLGYRHRCVGRWFVHPGFLARWCCDRCPFFRRRQA